MTRLHIGEKFSFPLEFITQTQAILAIKRIGKALALDTPIPIPTGWTTMADLNRGDEVFDENGRVCHVLDLSEVHEGRPCYRVVFSDRSEIVTDEEHLWLTETVACRRAELQATKYKSRGRNGRLQCERQHYPAPVTTKEILSSLHVMSGKVALRNHAIRCTRPLELPTARLPIDPYVLGAWLGDGTAQSSYITTADIRLLSQIHRAGYSIGKGRDPSDNLKSHSYRIGANRAGVPLHKQLRLLGLLNNKHVPGVYLRASMSQRLALLQGLMDTDGTSYKGQSLCEFNNSNPLLANAVEELAVSLGFSVRRSSRRAKLRGKECKIDYRVRFRPTMKVFRLHRKAARVNWNLNHERRFFHRTIIAVEPVESVPVQCILVDSPNNLYLAGKAMIPTHNTYTASVQAEELLKAQQQVVAIDITGAWWGLRSSADGKGAGYSILIAGGDHGDIPLEENAGHVLAEAVVSERFSAIIDLSLMRKAQAHRFLADFLETLYRKNRDAMHLFCDEADFYSPQRPWGEEARTLGAMSDIVRRGGIRGIGCTLITQRPAVLNKDVLTQCGILTCLRISHPRDMAAVKEWVDVHSSREQADTMMESLPALPKGNAWVWAPGWPDENGIFERIQVRRRITYDSGATPKAGEVQKSPKVVAEVDIQKLGAQIAATAQRILENDPKALKRRITELEKQTKTTQPDAEAVSRVVERAVTQQTKAYADQIEEMKRYISVLHGRMVSVRDTLNQYLAPDPPSFTSSKALPVPKPTPKPVAYQPTATSVDSELPMGERATLIAIAGYPDGIARDTVAVLTGYAKSTRDSYIKRLRTRGYVEPNGSLIRVTVEGTAALGSDYAVLPRGKELQDHWMSRLPEGEAKVLAVLIDHYPNQVQRPFIDEATGYAKSTRDSYIKRLRARRLVVSTSGGVCAVSDLFD